jgi:hypothetical protein
MKSRRLLIAITILAMVASICLALVAIAALRDVGTPINITVINKSNGTVIDIHLTHRHAGFAYIAQLMPGATAIRRLQSTRGGSVRISYFNFQRELKVFEGDIYVGSQRESNTTISIYNETVSFN